MPAVVISPSEVQTLLQIDDKYSFISDAIPIIQGTIDAYFDNSTWAWSAYPVSLKRPAVILIKQLMDNPGVLWREEVGDDEKEFRGINLDDIFAGLDSLKSDETSAKRAQFFNLESINTNLGIPNG